MSKLTFSMQQNRTINSLNIHNTHNRLYIDRWLINKFKWQNGNYYVSLDDLIWCINVQTILKSNAIDWTGDAFQFNKEIRIYLHGDRNPPKYRQKCHSSLQQKWVQKLYFIVPLFLKSLLRDREKNTRDSGYRFNPQIIVSGIGWF